MRSGAFTALVAGGALLTLTGAAALEGCDGDGDKNGGNEVTEGSNIDSGPAKPQIENQPEPIRPGPNRPPVVSSGTSRNNTNTAGELAERSSRCSEQIAAIYAAADELGTGTDPRVSGLATEMTDICMDALSGTNVDQPEGTAVYLPRVCRDTAENVVNLMNQDGLADSQVGSVRRALLDTCAIQGEGVLYEVEETETETETVPTPN